MIDPSFLDELDRFETATKRTAADLLQGEQESPRIGEGLTFSDYRRYAPGDDTRLVDWHLYARTEEYFVKQFEEERNLTVHVLLDASESMDFGVGTHRKFDFGAKVGLGAAYLSVRENNDFQFSIFRDHPDRIDTGRSSRGELLRLVEILNETDPSGSTDVRTPLEEYAETIHTRALVLVVSDYLTDLDDVEEGLAALSRNDLVVAQVLSPEELGPPPTGDTIFVDTETDESRRTYFGGTLVRQYQQRLDEHVQGVTERALDLGAHYALVDTGDDFFDAFAPVWVE